MERELGAPGRAYTKWAAKMALDLGTGVPWVMCKQDDAPDPIVSVIEYLILFFLHSVIIWCPFSMVSIPCQVANSRFPCNTISCPLLYEVYSAFSLLSYCRPLNLAYDDDEHISFMIIFSQFHIPRAFFQVFTVKSWYRSNKTLFNSIKIGFHYCKRIYFNKMRNSRVSQNLFYFSLEVKFNELCSSCRLTRAMVSIATTSLPTRLINQKCGLKPGLGGKLPNLSCAICDSL